MQGKKLFKRTLLGAACAFALAGASGPAMAANWLMLQGTEPEGSSTLPLDPTARNAISGRRESRAVGPR